MNPIIDFCAWLIMKYPEIGTFIMVIGALRVVIKPLMTAIDKYVEFSPSTKDDELWNKIKTSKVLSVVLFVLDWLASIKIPAKK